MQGDFMVKKYSMKRDGSKRTTYLYSRDGEVFYTKPDSDSRTSEWWGRKKSKGGRRYTLMAGLPAPKWLKDFFKM